ncbi:MAG: hypothetical protein K5928_04755 [Prevotella sp.]|nr:hypothetical protein [Prevotella sp.]
MLKLCKKVHLREINEACKQAHITLHEQPGEEEWIRKWSRLSPHLSIESYRFYSEFLGNDPNILSDDMFHAIIDPIINDKVSLPVYLNKNLYEILISKEAFPICIFRKMNGDYLDSDYKDFNMDENRLDKILLKNERIISQGRFIVKPTQETGHGKGVHLFCYKEGKWVGDNNDLFSLTYLEEKYGKDLIIQECIEPSDFVRQFNPTSYSTFRIYTYRSVVDGAIHFLGGYLRVGDVGSFKDNIGSGGYAIPISKDGTLASFASNGTRKQYETVNGIDLKGGHFMIPNFEKVLELAYLGAEKNPINRVLSFDILLDKKNQPHIIEFNLKAQTITTMQTTYKTFFGEFTDEIIDYCLNKMKNGYYPVYLNYLRKR